MSADSAIELLLLRIGLNHLKSDKWIYAHKHEIEAIDVLAREKDNTFLGIDWKDVKARVRESSYPPTQE